MGQGRQDQPRPEWPTGRPVLTVTGHFQVGGGAGEHGQFQLQVDVSGAAFTLDRMFVEVFEISAKDGSEINKVIVPVIYGPLIVDGYFGYREHVVQPGDTLSAIASAHYSNASHYLRIVRANPTQVSNPDLIFPGQILRVSIGN
ncbi:MAG: LysM peptidoglycan-binding domain-containing protein [Actinomycetota bacterium]|nr:LysM peptidoglycan-binding domain-containing protein [Actinomycetota bacterium]